MTKLEETLRECEVQHNAYPFDKKVVTLDKALWADIVKALTEGIIYCNGTASGLDYVSLKIAFRENKKSFHLVANSCALFSINDLLAMTKTVFGKENLNNVSDLFSKLLSLFMTIDHLNDSEHRIIIKAIINDFFSLANNCNEEVDALTLLKANNLMPNVINIMNSILSDIRFLVQTHATENINKPGIKALLEQLEIYRVYMKHRVNEIIEYQKELQSNLLDNDELATLEKATYITLADEQSGITSYFADPLELDPNITNPAELNKAIDAKLKHKTTAYPRPNANIGQEQEKLARLLSIIIELGKTSHGMKTVVSTFLPQQGNSFLKLYHSICELIEWKSYVCAALNRLENFDIALKCSEIIFKNNATMHRGFTETLPDYILKTGITPQIDFVKEVMRVATTLITMIDAHKLKAKHNTDMPHTPVSEFFKEEKNQNSASSTASQTRQHSLT